MNPLNQSAFLKALGWSLLDSLWQMGVLWLLYVLITANGKRFKSRQRHNLALLSLTGGSIWFFTSLVINYYKAISTPLIISPGSPMNTEAGVSGLFSSIPLQLEPILPIVSLAYLGILCILFFRFYRQYNQTQYLFSNGIQKINPELRIFLNEMVQRMSIKKEVRIWLSDLVDTPLTVGFWKPVLLLPVAAVNHLTLQQAEAIILHELHHIKGNDYFINLLIASMDILLFFNPFTKVIIDIIKKERENSCDDLVLQFRYDVKLYAKALLTLEQNRTAFNSICIAATGKNRKLLLERVKRMMKNEPVSNPPGQKLVAYLFSAALIGWIGWYNPGKVIVQKSQETSVFVPLVGLAEFPATFLTNNSSTLDDNSSAHKNKKPVKNSKQKYSTLDKSSVLEKVIEYLEEENNDQLNEMIAPALATYVNSPEVREFSIPENNVSIAPSANLESYPYVPSSSFSYQYVEDTSDPKKYIVTPSEIKAKESLEKAVKAMREINWQKLEKEMKASGKKVDIVKLQGELIKALEDVDWKKINDEMESSLEQLDEAPLKDDNPLRVQLQKFQKDRILQQEKLKTTHQNIIQNRLKEQCEDVKKKVKKIVYI